MARKYEFRPDKPYSGFLGKILLTRLQRKTLLKWCLYTLVLVVLSVLQDVLLCRFHIFGATTELVPCGIFLICILEGTERSCIFALLASLFYLFSGSSAGIYSIVLVTALAVGIPWLRQSYLQKGFGSAMLCTAVAMAVYELATFAFGTFLGMTTFPRIGRFLLTAVITTPAAPALYPILKAIGGGDVWKE